MFHRTSVASVAILCALAVTSPIRAAEAERDQWEQMDIVELGNLGEQLGTAPAEQRAVVGRYVEQRFGEAIRGGQMDWKDHGAAWVKVGVFLAPAFEPETQKALAAGIRRNIVPDADTVADLGGGTAMRAAQALRSLGLAEESAEVCVAWIDKSEKYKSADWETLFVVMNTMGHFGDEGSVAAKMKVARHVLDDRLSDTEEARKLDPGMFNTYSWALRNHMTDEQKQAWIDRLRTIFAADDATLGALPQYKAVQLHATLFMFGDPKATEIVGEWMELNDEWKKDRPAELLSLAGTGPSGEIPPSAKLRLARYVEERFFWQDQFFGPESLGTWSKLVAGLSKVLDGQAQQRWSARMHEAFVDNAETFRGLPYDELMVLRDALQRLRSDRAAELVATWVKSSDQWKAFGPVEKIRLAAGLGATREGKTVQASVLQQVESDCLANVQAVQSVSPKQWSALVPAADKLLDDRQRERWRQAIRAAYVADGESLGKLTFEQVDFVAGVLKALADPQSHDVVRRWVLAGDRWHGLNCAGLIRLTASVRTGTDDGAAAIERIVSHVSETQFGSLASVQAAPMSSLLGLTRALAEDLSGPRRADWRKKLQAALVENPQTLEQIEFGQACVLQDTLVALGAENTDVAARWIAKNPAWREMDFAGVLKVAASTGEGESGRTARRLVADHVAAKWLSEPEKTRSLTPANWAAMLARLGDGVPEDARVRWTSALRVAFVSDADTFAALDKPAVHTLRELLISLGDSHAELIWADWIAVSDGWRSLSPLEMAKLAAGFTSAAAAATVAEQIEQRYLPVDEARKVTIAGWGMVIDALEDALAGEVRPRWARKLRSAFAAEDEAIEQLSLAEFRILQSSLEKLGDNPIDLLATWLAGAVTAGTVTPRQGVGIAAQNAPEDHAGAVEARLSESIAATYLQPGPEKTRSVSLQDWSYLTDRLAEQLADPARRVWVRSLTQAFAADDEMLEQLTLGDFQALKSSLAHLDQETDDLLAGWLKAAVTSGTLSLRQAVDIEAKESTGQAPRRTQTRLAAAIAATYIQPGADQTRKVSIADWRYVISRLTIAIADEQRQLWIRRLKEAFASDRQLTRLSRDQIRLLIATLDALGDQTDQLLGGWLVQGVTSGSIQIDQAVAFLETLEGGTGSREMLAGKIQDLFLTDADKTRSVSLEDWSSIVGRIGRGLTEDSKADWADAIWEAYAAGDLLGEMAMVNVQYLGRTMGRLGDERGGGLIYRWIESGDGFKQLDGDTLARLAQSIRAERVSQLRKAHALLVRHVEEAILSHPSRARKLKVDSWLRFVRYCRFELRRRDQTRAWGEMIRAAYLPDREALVSLSAGQITTLVWVHKWLGDPYLGKMCTDWLSDPRARGKESVGGVFTVMSSTGAPGGDLTHKLEAEWVQAHRRRPVPSGVCMSISNYWRARNDDIRARSWAVRTLQSLAREGKAPPDSYKKFIYPLGLGYDLTNFDLKTLFSRVLAVPPAERLDVWNAIAFWLSREAISPMSDKGLTQLADFCAELSGDGGPLTPVAVLSYLLACTADKTGAAVLERRLCRWTVRQAAGEAPATVGALIERALDKEADGDLPAAVNLLDRGAESCPKRSPLREASRLEAAWLAMHAEPALLSVAGAQLEEVGAGGAWRRSAANLRWRLLAERCRRDPRQRAQTWSDGAAQLQAAAPEELAVYDRTLKALDALVASLHPSDTLSGQQVYADVLLCIPAQQSMIELQSRRAAALYHAGQADEATAALGFASLLAAGRGENPLEAAYGFCDAGKLPPKIADEIVTILMSWPGESRAAQTLVDPYLRQASTAAARSGNASEYSPRRMAMLSLLAGDDDRALKAAYRALFAGPSHPGRAADRMTYLASVVSLLEANLPTSRRFIARLAYGGSGESLDGDPLLALLVGLEVEDPGAPDKSDQTVETFARLADRQRTALARQVLARWREDLLGWADACCRVGEFAAAGRFYAAAVDTEADAGKRAQAIRALVGRIDQCPARDDKTAEALLATVPQMRLDEDRQEMLVATATYLCDTGLCERSMEILDRAADICPFTEQEQMSGGFLRARCLIGLTLYSDARELLGEMEDWPGSAEDHARAAFLIGWTYLKKNDRQAGLDELRRVTSQYPSTSFAGKAKQILDRAGS